MAVIVPFFSEDVFGPDGKIESVREAAGQAVFSGDNITSFGGNPESSGRESETADRGAVLMADNCSDGGRDVTGIAPGPKIRTSEIRDRSKIRR
jgi:hypothetical protein